MELKVSVGDFVYEHEGKLRDTYKIGKKLGEGAFSSVRAIKHRVTGESRAVKTVHKKSLTNDKERAMLFKEVSILRGVDHPNVVKLYEFYQDDKNFYIITELCTGGELFEKIIEDGSFNESNAATLVQQILSVLVYLHTRHIVHRDLKPENFLLSTLDEASSLKIIDFGSAEYFEDNVFLTEKQGTPYYIAPEVLAKQYTQSCDLWSVGVCMYIMLCGYPPFGGRNDQEILQKVRVGRFHFPSPEWDSVSFEAKDLIIKLMNFDPTGRISAKDALVHPWLSHASKLPINPQTASQYFNNLKTFKSEQMFQKATLAFMGSQLSTHEEREEMINLFKSLDADDSGTLSKEELREGFSKIFGDEVEDIETEIEKIMKEVDIDGSGEIDYSEFVTATLNRQKLLSRERLEIAFKSFDIDDSGAISADELKALLGKYHRYDEGMWQSLIREVDSNGDGEIDFDEFYSMMTSVLK